MNYKYIITALSACATATLFAHWSNTTSGEGSKIDEDKYACALISNGSLSTVVDNLGIHQRRKYVGITPCIAWEGRRYGVPKDALIPFGFLDSALSVDGKVQKAPIKWSQTLDNKGAFVENVVEYPDAEVKTISFIPLNREILAVKKIITPKKAGTVCFDFVYDFNSDMKGKEGRVIKTAKTLSPNCATFDYTAFGHKVYKGKIAIFSDEPSSPSFAGENVAVLSSKVKASPDKPLEISYFITFNDNFEKGNYAAESAKTVAKTCADGFDKIFDEHKAQWSKYWNGAYVEIPDKEIEKTYYTGLYHQRCNATKWSLPVGIFSGSHWNGRFFGWDEAFNAMALASSGKFDQSRKPSEFRTSKLNIARFRANKSNTGLNRNCGARFVWESMEDGHEGSPDGFWKDHIFHMSNMAMETWGNYLYTNDTDFLKANYELMVESCFYYIKNYIYVNGGKYTIGKCTDLERMGPAKENPYMTSCGVIYTLEKTAAAADVLGVDKELAKQWRATAAELRKTLPNDGNKYLPYPDSKDYSIGSVGGLYPYNVFDENDKLAKNAVYEFHKNIDKGGNMYDKGNGVNAWYAGWMSSALVVYNDKDIPAQLLSGAAKETGSFYDTYEINEPKNKARNTPWFSTGSGNYIYALNQMLARSTENGEIMVCTSVPDSWNDISFNLPCFGGLWLETKISGGKLVSIQLSAKGFGKDGTKKTVVIPSRFVDKSKIVGEFTERDGYVRISAEAGKSFYK